MLVLPSAKQQKVLICLIHKVSAFHGLNSQLYNLYWVATVAFYLSDHCILISLLLSVSGCFVPKIKNLAHGVPEIFCQKMW